MANENFGTIFHNGVPYGGGSIDTSALANKSDVVELQLTDTTNTSGSTITAGTWFYLNSKLVKAKVDIASNATFTKDTNYEEKTIGEELSELNSKIAIRNNTYYVGTWISSYGQTKAFLYVPCNVTIQIQLSNIKGGVITVNSYGTVPVTVVEAYRNGVLLKTDESYDTLKNLLAVIVFTNI